jgi:lipoyl-dependent peroxiredoxin
MAEIRRVGRAVWAGDLKAGEGHLSAASGVLHEVSYTFGTRFGDDPGTNPDELLATAHAACYSMNLAGVMAAAGHPPEQVSTTSTCVVERQAAGGFRITRMQLEARVRAPGVDAEALSRLASEAERTCPVSMALREGVEITLEVTSA